MRTPDKTATPTVGYRRTRVPVQCNQSGRPPSWPPGKLRRASTLVELRDVGPTTRGRTIRDGSEQDATARGTPVERDDRTIRPEPHRARRLGRLDGRGHARAPVAACRAGRTPSAADAGLEA